MDTLRTRVLAAGVGLVCLIALPVSSSYGGQEGQDYLRVRLDATRYNRPRVGFAVLEPAGSKTGAIVEVSNVPEGVTLPAHLYTYLYRGTCARHGAKPDYALDRINTAMASPSSALLGVMGRMPVPFDQVRSHPFAISVQLGAADGGWEIFCGNVAPS